MKIRQQLAHIVILTSFLLTIISCTPQVSTTPPEPTPTIFITSPATETATPSQCVTEKVNLNELANVGAFDEYRFSRDGQTIYLRPFGDWLAYSVSSRKVTPVSGPEIIVTPTPSTVEQIHRSILGEDYASLQYNLSLSPSGTRLIYWINTKRLNAPTATPSHLDLPDEDFGAIAYEEEDIFLLQNGSNDPIYLGKVNGAITHATWLSNEEQVVLEMLMFSPDFLWLVDIPSRSIKPILSRSDLPNVVKLGFWGISPDGNWAMFRGYGFTILNIHTSKTHELREIQQALGAWWTPDSKRILIVTDAGPGYYSVYLYDLATDQFTRIASDLPSEGSFKLVNISDHEAILANIYTDFTSTISKIYVLYLCLDE